MIFNPPIIQAWSPLYINIFYNIMYNEIYYPLLPRHEATSTSINSTIFKFLSPTNAPLYYTYKILKYTVKISHDCSYMFRSIWTIIREPMPKLAKEETLKRIKPWHKGPRMNCWETFYMQLFHQHGTLINEQHVNDVNHLYEIADTSRIPIHARNSVTNCMAHNAHHSLLSSTNQYVYILLHTYGSDS
jgi:hypothetical protein